MNATMRSFNRAAVVVGAPLGGLLEDRVAQRPALWFGSAGLAVAGTLLLSTGSARPAITTSHRVVVEFVPCPTRYTRTPSWLIEP